jgi:hypothetical protein
VKQWIAILALTSGVLAVIAGTFAYRFMYPYGRRTCFLPCMVTSLHAYAFEHEGRFPTGEDSFEALAKLHPMYDSGRGDMLAGLTGDRDAVSFKLQLGMKLSSNECSWVYILGRNSDSGKAVIIYERRSGVGGNGRRFPGRAVGFSDGSMEQIPDERWAQFIKDQALDQRPP